MATNTTSTSSADNTSNRASIDKNTLNEPRSENLSMSSPRQVCENPLRRLLRFFVRSKRASTVGLSDTVTVSHDDEEPEQEDSDEEVENEVEDTYSNDGEPNDYDEHDRPIRALPREAIEDFVLKLIHPEEELDSLTCRVTLRKEGSFHHAVFLQIELGEALEQEFILRIPAHGTPEHWKDGYAYMLRNEAVLMQHIRHHTDCPVPEVTAFDHTTCNPIGTPYILMKKMPGVSALDLWHGQPINTLVPGKEYFHTHDPSSATEDKRLKFLRSLTNAMSQLQNLEFDQVGLPVFDDAADKKPSSYGPLWRWHSKNSMQELTPIGPFDSSEDYFRAGLVWTYNRLVNCGLNSSGPFFIKGIRKILSVAFSSSPLASPLATSPAGADEITGTKTKTLSKESFVLRHDDLDLQNILVDNEGNVTGIIDWDGCMAVPRCVGYTSLPTFLRRDWLPGNDGMCAPHMTWSLTRYRDIYANAMKESCMASSGPLSDAKETDAVFTHKSAIYQALLEVLYDDADVRDVVYKMLDEIPDFRRVDATHFCGHLSRAWPGAEKLLEEKIPMLLRPE